jgi:hypothetical protein
MSTYTFFSRTNLKFFLPLIGLVLLTSCSRKIHFQKSAVAPAAEGKVTLKKDGNKNYEAAVEVYNLAKPERLSPPRNDYVVWLQAEDNSVRNVGRMVVNNSLFSSTMKGSLTVVTVKKPVKIFITAEESFDVVIPSSTIVLTTPTF